VTVASLSNVFGNLLTSWLYSSINEGVYNATPAPWTNEEWAFVPVDLTSVPITSQNNATLSQNSPAQLGTKKNISFITPSIGGRLECTPIDMSNTSAWLTTLDFTNKTAWNDSKIPSDLKVGYELKLGLSMDRSVDGHSTYYDDQNPYFSFFATNYRLTCCGNETNGTVNEATIGYWSPAADSEHTSVVVKWITGHPFATQFNDSTPLENRSSGEGYNSGIHWVWKDIPKVTALNCTPIFETSNASITVDLASRIVQDCSIINTPIPDINAWGYGYVGLNVSKGVPYSQQLSAGAGFEVTPGFFLHNVSVRYFLFFIASLLETTNTFCLQLRLPLPRYAPLRCQ